MEQNDDIDRFLEGKSSKVEIENLRRKAEEDEAFAKQLFSEIELKHSLRYVNRMTLKEKLEKLDEIEAPKENESFSFFRIAASIILIATAGLSIWYFTLAPKTNEVFLAYYEPIAEIDLPSSRGVDDMELLENASSAYFNGDYKSAVELSKKVSSEPVLKAYANFILGMSQMEMEKFGDAIESFSVALQTISPIQHDIKWYRALCYINLGDNALASTDLNDLVETKYSERADQILRDIKN